MAGGRRLWLGDLAQPGKLQARTRPIRQSGPPQRTLPRMRASSDQGQGELMALSVAVTAGEQSARRLRQELQPDQERHRAIEKGWSFLWRQIGNGLEIQRDGLLEPVEYLLKGSALDRNVELEAGRLPIAVQAPGVAMQSSGRQPSNSFGHPQRRVTAGAARRCKAQARYPQFSHQEPIVRPAGARAG